MRIALCARFSSDLQSVATIERHLPVCREGPELLGCTAPNSRVVPFGQKSVDAFNSANGSPLELADGDEAHTYLRLADREGFPLCR